MRKLQEKLRISIIVSNFALDFETGINDFPVSPVL